MAVGVYTGVLIVNNFAHLDEFYKSKVLPLDKFGIEPKDIIPNRLIVAKSGKNSVLGIIKGDNVRFVPHEQKIHNIVSRNREQSMLIQLLRDPEIACVTICGPAGSGKTLLALAFAMEQLQAGKINKVVLSKNLSPLGREVGFIKGDLGDKMRPWCGAFFDNMEVLGIPPYELDNLVDPYGSSRKDNPVGHIEISPTTFMQGRSISNAVIIMDESQNSTTEIVKAILTRPAENSKIVLLGDLAQIVEKDAVKNSGFAAAIEAGKGAPFIGHITLIKCVRSLVADWYSRKL